MGWADGQLLGFDTETTSASPFTALPVSYAFVLRRDASRMSVKSAIINPGHDIPEEATAIHGISTERARAEGISLAQALEEIQETLVKYANADVPLVGCNLSYDLTIIHRLIGLDLWAGCAVDVFVMDRHWDTYRKGKRTLSALREHYRVTQEGEAHDAASDAISAILVALAMAERYPELEAMNMADLHNAQEVWADEQRSGLSKHFVRQGGEAIPEEQFGWPIQNGVKQAWLTAHTVT